MRAAVKIKRLLPFLIVLAAVGLAGPLRAQDSLRIAAVVNDDVISQFDLAVRTRMVIVSSRLEDTPEIRRRLTRQVLRSLIDERLKMQEAKRLGVVVNEADVETQIAEIAKQNNMTLPEFEAVLERNGILRQTLVEQVRAEIAWAIVVQRRMRPSIAIGDDEIDEALALIADNQGKPEYRLSEIFLATDTPGQEEQVQQTAERLSEEVRQGADFAAVARQFSQSATAAAGGDLGWVRPGQLDPELDAAVAGMQRGQVAGPIRGIGGYYLLHLRDTRRTAVADPEDGRVSMKQVFIPLAADAPAEQVEAATVLARSVEERARSCDDMTRLGRETSPQSNSDLGVTAIRELPDALRGIALDLPIGQPSGPLRVASGVGVYMVCGRDLPAGGLPSRQEIGEQLIRERLEVLVRQNLRDLRRAAYVDLRV